MRAGVWCCVAVPSWPACGARSLTGRAVAQAGGTHSSSDQPIWLRGRLCWCQHVALVPGSGACACGGGLAPFYVAHLALPSLFPALPYTPSLGCARTRLAGLRWFGSPGVAPLVLSDMVVLSCRAAWMGSFLGTGSSVLCSLGVQHCACSVLGHLATVHRCARLVRCVVCAVS